MAAAKERKQSRLRSPTPRGRHNGKGSASSRMTKHSAEVAGRVEGFASAFFIDTRSRLLRLPASHAQATFWAKALLLLGNLPLVWVLSGAGTSAVAKQCLHVPGSSCVPQLLYFFISDSRGAVAPLLSISPCHQPTHPTGAGPLSDVQTRTHARTHAHARTHTHRCSCTLHNRIRIAHSAADEPVLVPLNPLEGGRLRSWRYHTHILRLVRLWCIRTA